MAYNFPYCTFDKLRISNANGIKFRYLTGDGSFFEGETLPDNTFYNDDSNCGFNWEPFSQKIPCDGIIRLQFQWCDSDVPLIHIFQDDEFIIEVNPTKVYSASFDIYEIELNFGTESDFCNSCIDLRIATQVTDINWFGSIIKGDATLNAQVGNNGNFDVYSVEGTPIAVSVYESNGALVVSQKADLSYSVFKFTGSVFTEIYNTTTSIAFIKAFDLNNWIAVGSSNKLIISKNGTVTEQFLTGNTPIGLDGYSVDDLYIGINPFMDTARILHYINGVFTEDIIFPASFVPQGMHQKDNYLYIGGYVTSTVNNYIQILSLIDNTFTNVNTVTATGSSIGFVSAFSRTNFYGADLTDLYFSNGVTINSVPAFTTIRGSDSSSIRSIYYFGENVLYVVTQQNVYLFKDSVWSVVYTSESFSFLQIAGYYNSNTYYNYHAQSEPIHIASTDCLIPIEYWNDDNYDGQYFCDGFKNILYIEAQFTKFSPIETSSVYVTSNNEKRVLSKNIAKKREFDINYIPEYLHDIVTIAFSMGNLTINGKSYTAESDYKIQDNNTLYSLYKASIEVYENLYKFENSNCDNECGGNQPATPACTLPDSDGIWGGNAEI